MFKDLSMQIHEKKTHEQMNLELEFIQIKKVEEHEQNIERKLQLKEKIL